MHLRKLTPSESVPNTPSSERELATPGGAPPSRERAPMTSTSLVETESRFDRRRVAAVEASSEFQAATRKRVALAKKTVPKIARKLLASKEGALPPLAWREARRTHNRQQYANGIDEAPKRKADGHDNSAWLRMLAPERPLLFSNAQQALSSRKVRDRDDAARKDRHHNMSPLDH